MKITTIGQGYVGLSLSVLLSQKYSVIAYDTDKIKVKKINKRISPIQDEQISKFFKKDKLILKASSNMSASLRKADFVIICVPTNYNPITNRFDTEQVEKSIKSAIKYSKDSTIVIKSTVPLGFTKKIRKKYNNNIFFSPEFLRESNALFDNLYPSRIIVGDLSDKATIFADMLKKCAKKNKIRILKMSSSEAEAVKLFSNTFLAMRVAYFNELDTYCEMKNLNTKKIIDGVGLDPRIGNHYNNPSFGYGGYCLPKDTKQLLSNFKNIPNNIISSVIQANETRKNFIVSSILKNKPNTVGIYRLVMKSGSDNFRNSAIIDIIKKLAKKKIKMIIFEPQINTRTFLNLKCYEDLDKFIKKSDLIIANRASKEINNVKNKIYTRDLFGKN